MACPALHGRRRGIDPASRAGGGRLGVGRVPGFLALLIVIPLSRSLALVLGLLGFLGLLGSELLAGIVAVLGLVLAFGFIGFFLATRSSALLSRSSSRRTATGRHDDRSAVAADRRDVLLMAIGVAVVVIVTFIEVIGGILRFSSRSWARRGPVRAPLALARPRPATDADDGDSRRLMRRIAA